MKKHSPQSAMFAALTLLLVSQAHVACATDLLSLSLEQLGALEVTSVARKRQSVTETASAVHVITAEDIRRTGATSIPEALMSAPGMYVARINGGRWVVATRHLPGRFSNTLLVLLDGRSVFSELYRGVFWENIDVPMHDVERIEVIRGPGAAVWGSNAIDGVINIMTRRPQKSDAQVALGAGNNLKDDSAATLDTRVTPELSTRVFARSRRYDDGRRIDGGPGQDGGRISTAGLRMEYALNTSTSASLSAGRTEARLKDEVVIPTLTSPYSSIDRTQQRSVNTYANLRVDTRLAGGSDLTVQASVTRDDIRFVDIASQVTATSFDVQQRTEVSRATDVVWGIEFKRVEDSFTGARVVSIPPPKATRTFKSGFVHVEHALLPELRLIAGTKIEKVGEARAEVQPTLRTVLTANSQHSFWAAASRPVRPQSRAEVSIIYNLAVVPPNTANNPGPLPVLVQLQSDPGGLKPVRATAFEAGWRWQVDPSMQVDVALFRSRYTNLSTGTPARPQPVLGLPPYILQPILRRSSVSETSSGLELSFDWRPLPSWKFSANAAFTNDDGLSPQAATGLPTSILERRKMPKTVLYVALSHDLTSRLSADLQVRQLTGFEGMAAAKAHSLVDARIAWRPMRQLELAILGKGLNKAKQLEFVTDFLPTPAVEIPRSVQLRAHWAF